jgi:uncharacterized membrane protein YgdD (TMEM256/DUF423 family)
LGAHWIKKKFNDPKKSDPWAVAAHYQIVHAIPLLLISGRPSMQLGGWLLTAGITLFSGSIYGLVLRPQWGRWLGPVTPIGGLCLIAGWAALAIAKK